MRAGLESVCFPFKMYLETNNYLAVILDNFFQSGYEVLFIETNMNFNSSGYQIAPNPA